MRPLFPSWALLLVAAILFVAGLFWVRAHPPEQKIEDPLLEAREALARGPGLEVATEIIPQGGVRVERVRAGSPADRAGIRRGDRIVACRDQSVWHAQQLWEFIREVATKRLPVMLLVERKGAYRPTVLGGRPAVPGAKPGGRAEAAQ